jgi:trehalose 6-phosphate phosphatase
VNHLFSSASLRILESLSFTETLYAFDFDGTLAPIVEEPQLAKMTKSTEKLFSLLSERVPTAVISGRSLSDMRDRVPCSTRFLIGNHGLEGLPGGHEIEDLRRQCVEWKQILQRKLNKEIQDPGVILEDKQYSLAIHYRKSRQKKQARARALKVIGLLDGSPRIIPGKLVLNIVPPGPEC